MLGGIPAAEMRGVWQVDPPPAGLYIGRVHPFGGGAVIDLKISSWQGTAHKSRSDFLQIQMPVPDVSEVAPVLDAIAQGGAALSVYRMDPMPGGAWRWQRMLIVPLQQWYLNEGPRRRALTLSGRSRAEAYPLEPGGVSVRGGRTRMTTMQGRSARANLDPRVYPGVAVTDGSAEFTVRYVNWYAAQDEWMQAGE
jgi:hypothetical protein